jgi:phosphate starvation-inducible PhoH-like protein
MAKKSTSRVNLPIPKNENQKQYINAMQTAPMVVTLGPAGTGKTYLAAIMAAYMLKKGMVRQVIVTRPLIKTKSSNSAGFLPGTLEEKMAPWCAPVLETLEDTLGKAVYESQVRNGNIRVVALEHIRGRSFRDAFVLLDEAQNCSYDEIKAFVTRIGERCTVVVNGDVTQSDLNRSDSGLSTLVNILGYAHKLRKFSPLIEFTSDDVVRSGLCQMWVQEFEQREKPQVEVEDREGLDKTLLNGNGIDYELRTL